MEKRTAEQESETKRLKVSECVYDILNQDLAEWKARLSKVATATVSSESKWKLVFFSEDLGGGNSLYSYPTEPLNPWKFEEYETTLQNMGGTRIAFAKTQEDLAPVSILAEKRLQLFGFVYVICPIDLKLTKSRRKLSEKFGNVTYGNTESRFNARAIAAGESLPIPESYCCPEDGKIDLEDPDYIDAIYGEYGPRGQDEIIEWHRREVEDIEKIEIQISELMKKQRRLIRLYETRREISDTSSRPGSSPYKSNRRYEPTNDDCLEGSESSEI